MITGTIGRRNLNSSPYSDSGPEYGNESQICQSVQFGIVALEAQTLFIAYLLSLLNHFFMFEKSDTLNIKIRLMNKKAHYKSSRVEKIEQFFLVWFVSNVGGKGKY